MKIRTDFVTNSSSSSFVLVIRVSLKNGKVLRFMGDGGVGEGDETYYELVANASPKELAQSSSIPELIVKLKASVLEDGLYEDGTPVLDNDDSLIKGLMALSSMNEIEKITINGDLYGRDEQHKYEHYTYYMDSGIMAYDVGGDEYIYSEGTGGEIRFREKGLPCVGYGKTQPDDAGYIQNDYMMPAYDADVEIDPEAKKQEERRLAELNATYDVLRQKYFTLIQQLNYDDEDINFFGKSFLINTFDNQELRADLVALCGSCCIDLNDADYLVIDETYQAPESYGLEGKIYALKRHAETIERYISNVTLDKKPRLLKFHALCNAIAEEKTAGCPSIAKGIAEWKKEIPFDHVAAIDFAGKNFAFVGSSAYWMINHFGIEFDSYETNPIKAWTVRKGGTCLKNVTLKCDYVVAGLNAKGLKELETALRYRDTGKSQLKIIPEDEFLKLLNGDTLEVSEDEQKAMEARRVSLEKMELKKQQTLEKERQKKEENERQRLTLRDAAAAARRERAEAAERQRVEREAEKQRQKEAEEVVRQERIHKEAAERERMIRENVLYRPGEEPVNIRRRIDTLFPKLDAAYPDKRISGLSKDHKKWGETVTELYRALGYPDRRAFLEAYGYTVIENKGGRPASNNYDEVISEIKRRYPDGLGNMTVADLKVANSDLPIKTMENTAKELFGMPLSKYLAKIGLFSQQGDAEAVSDDQTPVQSKGMASVDSSVKERDYADNNHRKTESKVPVVPAKEKPVAKSEPASEITMPIDCDKLKTLSRYLVKEPDVILPAGFERIDSHSVVGKNSLKSVVIPEGFVLIDKGAFASSSKLESVTLPKTLKHIGQDAFSDCEKLKDIVIPDGVEIIGPGAFCRCGELQNIVFPAAIKLIDEWAFDSCAGLRKVFISDGCKKIGDDAFMDCPELKDVYIPASVREFGIFVFAASKDINRRLVIHTIKGSAAEMYAQKNDIAVEYDYIDFAAQMHKKEENIKSQHKVLPQPAEADAPDSVYTDLYIILNNEKLLGKLNRPDEEFYECYAEDFPKCSKTELFRKRRRILNYSKGSIQIPKQHIDAFKARSVTERFGVSTSNLFNMDNSEIDFDKKAEKAIERTKAFYTAAELSEVRQLMDRKLRDTRTEIDKQYDAIESMWKHYSDARNHVKVYLVDPDTSEREADCIFQQEQDNTLVMIKMAKPGMTFIVVRLINCMAWYWNVTPQQIWEQALRNGVEDQRSHTTGNAVDIARKAFHQLFPEVAAAAERERVAQQRAKEEAEAKERREHIQTLEQEISALEYERDNLRGLFKGGKRKKLQAQIDELRREVNSLNR